MIVGGIVLAAVPFIAEAVGLLRSDFARLAATMSDDAFYYLEIGRRAARGEGWTFDGVNSTTGFHPLWQWWVTVLHRVVPGEVAFVQAARLLGLALTAAAVVIVVRLLWRFVGSYAALGALVLASHGVLLLRLLSDGMETGIAAVALALLLWAMVRLFESGTERSAVLTGVATVVVCLARFDLVVMVPVVGAAVVWWTRSARQVVEWAIGGLVTGVPYLVWHLAANDGLMTTSMTVKGQWTSDLVARLGGRGSGGHLRELGVQVSVFASQLAKDVSSSVFGTKWALVGALAIAVLTAAGAVDALRREPLRIRSLGPFGGAAAVVLSGLLLQFVLNLWATPQWVNYWYSVPLRLALLLAVGSAAGSGTAALLHENRAAAFALLGLSAIVLVPSGLASTMQGADTVAGQVWQTEIRRAADWIVAAGPPGTYGAYDAGLIGYRLDGSRRLVNLDGLVNDHGYADFITNGPSRLDAARREGVDYLVNDLRVAERQGDLGCAVALYEGAGSVRADAETVGPDRMYVLDLRPCFGQPVMPGGRPG